MPQVHSGPGGTRFQNLFFLALFFLRKGFGPITMKNYFLTKKNDVFCSKIIDQVAQMLKICKVQ